MLNKSRLLTPGPTLLPDRVRLAMSQDMVHHRKSVFMDLLKEIQPKLQELFGTTQRVLPLTSSGTGAMTAAVHNLFAPGECVCVINAGKFAQRWIAIAKARGLEVMTIDVAWGKAVAVEAVEKLLNANPQIKGLLVQMSETSTGVQEPVQELANLTRTRDVLLVVDGVSGVGISPCPMDAWGIDCLVSGSQKGLFVPPGLAFIAFSPRGVDKVMATPAGCHYFDMQGELAAQEGGQCQFTPAISLLYGLRESLRMVEESGGFTAVFRKQWALTMMARKGVQAIGLELMAPVNFTWGVTSVLLPAGVQGGKLLELAAKEWGVIIEGGQDHLKGRIIRIGHMGWTDWADIAAGLHAIVDALRKTGGYTASRDYLEQALEAYSKALLVEPGTPID